MKSFKKSHELAKRLFCTFGVLAVFLLGRNILLYRVDSTSLLNSGLDVQAMLVNMVSGDMYRCSIFALGIMPYMTSSIFVSLGIALLPQDVKKRISKPKMERFILISSFVLACFFAYSRANELSFDTYKSIFSENNLRFLAILTMIIGAMIIVYLIRLNKEHGIGQQTPIILVNIVQGLYSTISKNMNDITFSLALICLGIFVVTVSLENVEKHIPVQRVSIHNIYADKNYIAFKLNTIGIMPVMFSTSVFMLVKYLIQFIGSFFPNNPSFPDMVSNMNFNNRYGVITYLVIVFLFTILFSFVTLQPKEMADSLQKGGDSIVGVYAGRPTVRYFRLTILLLSCLSGIILASCISITMILSLKGYTTHELAMLPTSFMFLIGFTSNLIEEISGYYKFDSYKFFI